jgi:hypothetical protein
MEMGWGSIGLTVKRSAPSRRFFCVPAKRQRIVIINAMKAVTVGNRLLKSIIAIAIAAVVCSLVWSGR